MPLVLQRKSILYRIYRVQSIFSIDVMVLIVILGEREAEITLQVFEHKAVEQIVANGSWFQSTGMQRSHRMKLEFIAGDESCQESKNELYSQRNEMYVKLN